MRLTCQADFAIDYFLYSAVALMLSATFAEAGAAEGDRRGESFRRQGSVAEAGVSSPAEPCEAAPGFDELSNRTFELDPPSSGRMSQLASFSIAYWDETGISSPLLPEENTSTGLFAGVGSACDPQLDPEYGVVTAPPGTGDHIPWLPPPDTATARRMRAASLWDLRARNRLMLDGLPSTKQEAIERHQEARASSVTARYPWLSATQKCQLMSFLDSR